MHPIITKNESAYKQVTEWLKKELAHMRTGRATPALVEDISVRAYDSQMDMKSVASITAQDTQTLVIEPWDKSILQAIEGAIQKADIGINPVIDGEVVRLNMPPMTEETRLKLVKTMKQTLEEAKVRVRGVREQLRDEANQQEEAKEMSEDEKFRVLDEIESITKQYVGQIEEMGKTKESEIMTV